MKRFTLLLFAAIVAFIVVGCDATTTEKADTVEASVVNDQQLVYAKNQPIPFFDYSLDRDLWTQFYSAKNKAVATWSYITPQNSADVLFETPSMGYAIPMDTQLTNPFKLQSNNFSSSGWAVTLPQAEPNGLFTSPNTDGTIIMALNSDGTVAPVYTELKVTTFPFPVKWTGQKWVRLGESKIKLKPKTR